MYESDTILKLKDQVTDEEDPAFPYNRVRVVGASPIDHGLSAEQWSGTAGKGVIVTPLAGFSSTLDEPLGKLQQLYEVESVPKHEAPAVPVRVVDQHSAAAGPTPEEVFAEEAPGEPSKDGERVRTPHVSPLDAKAPEPEPASPLDRRAQNEQRDPDAD